MKISIIGMGNVGSTLAYTLMLKGLADELALIDNNVIKAQSDAADLRHALTFTHHITSIHGGDVSVSNDSDILVIAASVPWKPGYRSRFDLAPGNLEIFKSVLPELARLSPKAVLIIITNPLDVMTYFAIRLSGFPWQRVLGVGTLIDSARFRQALSESYQIHPDDIRAYILGEHGDSHFPAISAAYTGGVKIDDSREIDQILKSSQMSAHNIVAGKGYTNFAIAMATSLVIASVVHNENRTMPLSSMVHNFAGVSDVCVSIPVVVGRSGITQCLHLELNDKEKKLFQTSASLVRREIDKLVEHSRDKLMP